MIYFINRVSKWFLIRGRKFHFLKKKWFLIHLLDLCHTHIFTYY
jgi:hypothetical protein